MSDDAVRDPVEILRGIRLFSAASPDELAELAGSLKRRSYKKGEVVYHQDDPPGSLFIIASGIVKMLLSSDSGKEITISWSRPGAYFGTASLFDDSVRPDSAVALEPSELLVLPRDELQAYLRRHPEATEIMLQVMAGRFRFMMQRLHDLTMLDVPARLAKVLLQDFALAAESGYEIPQREIGALIGATRESVNKWLKVFEQRGWIECRHGSVTVLQPDRLREHIG